MLKVAIVGVGHIALSQHIPAFLALGDEVNIVAAVARSPQKCEQQLKELGINHIYTDIEEMLSAEKPDIVDICTPNISHESLTRMALDAGCDVLCEKPIAMTYAAAKELYELAAEKGCRLMACQTRRFINEWQQAKAFIQEGHLGEIYNAECKWVRHRGIPTWGNFHIKEENGGGAMCDLGVHLLDALFWYLGTKEVTAVCGATGNQLVKTLPATAWRYDRGGHFLPEEMDVEEWAMGSLVTDSGAVANFHFSWATNGPEEFQMRLNGTKGCLSIPDLTFYPAEGDPISLEKWPESSSHGHVELIRAFVEAKENGAPLPVLPEETLLVTKVIEDFYRQGERK